MTDAYCDFHTHTLSGKCPELLSTPVATTARYQSLEYHPWYLPETFAPLPEDMTTALPGFTALGEIGLDRLRGPELPVQMRYLEALLALAQDCRKPVVLHVVKALPELFSVLKRFRLRWMIHGFRGTPETLDAIWQRGGVVSFHPEAVRQCRLMDKLKTPGGSFGFESDAAVDADLPSVIKSAVARSGNRDLPQLVNAAFGEFTSGQ